MTYPQPRTQDQISAAARQWRLFTQVQGQGEIYEIDSSSSSIALGPESDFAQVGITYLDPSVPVTSQATIRITPQNPFAGALAPRLDTSYPLSPPRKGRMLVSFLDNFNTGYVPKGFAVASMQKFLVLPYLDLIGWQQAVPPSLPTRRGDKEYVFQQHEATVAVNGAIWYIVPAFGRKYMFAHVYNNSGGVVTYEVRGVNFATISNPNASTPGTGNRNDEEASLVVSAGLSDQAVSAFACPASTKGMFDAFAFFLSTAAGGVISNCPLRIYLSDDPL